MENIPSAITPSPVPWQSPLVQFQLEFNLPDGTPVSVPVSAHMSEPWTLWYLQRVQAASQTQGEADVAFALASSRGEFNRGASVSDPSGSALAQQKQDIGPRLAAALGQINALFGVVQALSARVNQLSAALNQAQIPTVPQTPRPPAFTFLQGLLSELPANGSYSDGSVLFYATDTKQVYASVAGVWVPIPTRLIQDIYASIPMAGSYADGSVIFYATDNGQLYVSVAGAWVQVMAYLSFDNGTNTLTFAAGAHLAGTHAQDVGTTDTPAFADVITTSGSVDGILASLQAQINTKVGHGAPITGTANLTTGAVTGTVT